MRFFRFSAITKFLLPHGGLNLKNLVTLAFLFGLGLIIDRFLSLDFLGNVQLGLTGLILIIVGAVWGVVVGVFFALLFDTTTLVLAGRVYQGMGEYSLQVVLIILISSLVMQLFRCKKTNNPIFSNIIAIVSIVSTIIFLVVGQSQNDGNIFELPGFYSGLLALGFFSILLVVANVLDFRHSQMLKLKGLKDERKINGTFSLAIILCVYLLLSGVMGSGTYARLIERMFNLESKNYLIYVFPKVLKSILTVPVGGNIIYLTVNAINFRSDLHLKGSKNN